MVDCSPSIALYTEKISYMIPKKICLSLKMHLLAHLWFSSLCYKALGSTTSTYLVKTLVSQVLKIWRVALIALDIKFQCILLVYDIEDINILVHVSSMGFIYICLGCVVTVMPCLCVYWMFEWCASPCHMPHLAWGLLCLSISWCVRAW